MSFLFIPLLVLGCLYALVAGGGPERVGAAVYGLACFSSLALFSAPTARFRSIEVGVFAVDVLVFIAFLILALRANRFWPIWVSGLLGLGVLGHLARWAGPEVIPWAYAVILSIWSYPILAIIVIGTFNHRRRLARLGADASWSSSSAPLATKRRAGPTG